MKSTSASLNASIMRRASSLLSSSSSPIVLSPLRRALDHDVRSDEEQREEDDDRGDDARGLHDDPSLEAMRTAVADLGMALTTSTFVPQEANPIASEPAHRAAAVDYLKARVDEAHLLGSELLVGGIYQAHKIFSGRGPTEQGN